MIRPKWRKSVYRQRSRGLLPLFSICCDCCYHPAHEACSRRKTNGFLNEHLSSFPYANSPTLKKSPMKLHVLGQSHDFPWCFQLHLKDTDLIRWSRKLRCSAKCFFFSLLYELPCLTLPISKGVWPAFLPLFFFFSCYHSLSRQMLTLSCSCTHARKHTHAHVHTCTHLVYH